MSSLQLDDDESEDDESHDLKAKDAPPTVSMDAFQIKMRATFEQLRITQGIHGAQLAEMVESTRRYVHKLAHQRVCIDRQEVMLARLYSKFFPDQGSSGGPDFCLQ